MSRRGVDEKSGLIFFETSSRLSTGRRTWQYKTRGIVPAAKNNKAFGAAPLKDIVFRKIARLVDELEPAHFLNTEWMVAKPLWDFMSRHDLVSLETWKLFAQAFPKEPAFKHFLVPSSKFLGVNAWATALRPLISPSFSFITALNIAEVSLSRADLISLPEVVNLGTLTLGPAISVLLDSSFHPYQGQDSPRMGIQHSVDDSIVMAWSYRVSQNDGWWSHLRSLHMRNQRQLTQRCLGWLSKFPSLAGFSIDHLSPQELPAFKATASGLGWELTQPEFNSEPVSKSSNQQSWYRPAEEDFLEHSSMSEKLLGAERAADINMLPLLQLRVSEPTQSAFSGQRLNDLMRKQPTCFRRRAQAAVPQSVRDQVGRKRRAENTTGAKRLKARNLQDTGSALAEFGV